MARKIPKMKDMTTKERNKLPASAFGLPNERKYPIDVPGQKRTYAMAAKKRAAQQKSMGNLSGAQAAKITRKAERVLGRSDADKLTDHFKKRGF